MTRHNTRTLTGMCSVATSHKQTCAHTKVYLEGVLSDLQ